MACNKVVQIKDKEPQHALDSLNRMTGLNWERLPRSLLPKGTVINGLDRQQNALASERKRA